MKKRWTFLIICMMVFLVACGSEEPKEKTCGAKTIIDCSKAKEELIARIPTPIPENENPLTGIGDLSKKAIGMRPVAVMVNNVSDALPQYGISQADVIFEIPVEGNLTRLMALYGDYTAVPKICPIRSCRYYYPALANGFDAYYVHWGSDPTIRSYLYGLDIDRFDGMANSLGLFGRDTARRNQGYALEHTGYFDGTGFASAIKKEGIRTKLAKGKKGTAFKFCGMDDIVTPTGKETTQVHIDFGPCTSTFDYNEKNSLYVKKMNGQAHKDVSTGETLKFTNLIILETTIYTRDAKGHKSLDWKGGKDAVGYYISNGTRQKISWEKKSEEGYLKFYNAKGKELKINRGKTYIAFVSPGMETFAE